MLSLEGKADCFGGLKLMHIMMILLLWRLSAARYEYVVVCFGVCVQVEEEIGRRPQLTKPKLRVCHIIFGLFLRSNL